MRRATSFFAAVAIVATQAAAGAAHAQPAANRPASGRSTSGEQVMSQQSPPAAGKPRPPTASTNAYRDAATQLQRDMGIAYTGDPDKDFAALLAAYRKGEAAIARIQLQHGADPDLRRLAEQAVAASEKDQATLHAWQGTHR